MSYSDGKGLIISGANIIGTIEQASGDITVAPFGTSIVSTALCDLQYEVLAAATSRQPGDVPEVELIAALGLTDVR